MMSRLVPLHSRFPPQDGLPGFRAGVAVRFPAGPAGLPEGRPAGTKDQILIEMEGDFPGELNQLKQALSRSASVPRPEAEKTEAVVQAPVTTRMSSARPGAASTFLRPSRWNGWLIIRS